MASSATVLVMMHGLTGSADLMRPLAERLAPEGWSTLLPEGPETHPKRGRAWWLRDAEPSAPIDDATSERIRAAAEGLAATIAASTPADSDLVVGGFSQGSAMALELLHSDLEPRIRGVLVLGGKSADPKRLAARLARIERRAALWMHGERDRIVPMAQAEEALDLLVDAGWTVERMRHRKGHMVDHSRIEDVRRWIAGVV